MRKLLNICIVFLLAFVFLSATKQSYAASCNAPTTGFEETFPGYPVTQSHVVTIDLSQNFDTSHDYQLVAEDGLGGINKAASAWFSIDENISNLCNSSGNDCVSVRDGLVTWTITSEAALTRSGGTGSSDTYYVDLNSPWGTVGPNQCDVGKYYASNVSGPGSGCTMRISQNRNGQTCGQNAEQNACFANGIPITVRVTDLKDAAGNPWNTNVGLRIDQEGVGPEPDTRSIKAVNGQATFSITLDAVNFPAEYNVYVQDRVRINERFPNCEISFTLQSGCGTDQCEEVQDLDIGGVPVSVAQEAFSLCKQIPDTPEFADQRANCLACTTGTLDEEGNRGVWTAVGCIQRDPQSIVQRFISVGLGMAGGVALITFLAAGFIFSTSQGDPKAYGKAKEMMTASIVGIIFVIFSVTILQFIGYQILRIPGFGG